jgi:iron complex outermembrane receptor protein
MLAFPDRFIRDAFGTLVRVDLRPVNFDSEREKKFRWGFNMNTRLGGQKPAAVPKPGAPRQPLRPGTYFQLNANYTIVTYDRIVIRPGLPPVDLLKGGAVGIGGGRGRHQLDATASLNSGGLGARVGINWRGKSTLVTRIPGGGTDTLTFSPQASVNLRLFAEGKRVIPKVKWAKGLRFTLDVANLFDNRKRVRDSLGDTPLQYQPGYLDPIGRTVEFEIRAVF